MSSTPIKDLVLLVADENMRFTMKGILSRSPSLAIRSITCDPYVHPQRDPGCLMQSHEFLRSRANQYAHALVMFDRDGCGHEKRSREELEQRVEERLSAAGWEGRSAAIALDPELEIWVWNESPHVDAALGWTGKQPDLRSWLKQCGFTEDGQAKIYPPKEAVERALKAARKPRSSAIYAELAGRVSFERCTDAAFTKLRDVLRGWFPPMAAG